MGTLSRAYERKRKPQDSCCGRDYKTTKGFTEMSAFFEYLKLIPKGIANPEQIIEGLVNNIKLENKTLPEDKVAEILRRRLICAGCVYMSKNREKLDPEFKSKRKESFCTLCSCPIISKTASLDSSCGALIYNKQHPDDLKEVKWTKYDNSESGLPDKDTSVSKD